MQNRRKRVTRFRPRFYLITGVIICFILIIFQMMFFAQGKENRDFLQVTLTQDVDVLGDGSLYRLILEWSDLKEDNFEEINIKINEEEFQIKPTATKFEVDLSGANTQYNIEFQGIRRGFSSNRRAEAVVNTLGDNDVLGQEISQLNLQTDYFSFEHNLSNLPEAFDLSTVTYELVDLWQQKTIIVEPELISEGDGVGTFKISVPLGDSLKSPSLSLNLRAKIEDTWFLFPVTHTVSESNLPASLTKGGFTLNLENGQFVLLNDQIEAFDYEGHTFFAESMHVNIDSEVEVKTYQLVNMNGDLVVDHAHFSKANQGIDLSRLEAGTYFVLLNENMIHVEEEIHDFWHTVTRDGYSNKVTVHNFNGALAINVERVSELPDDIYDILIDPGHGGLDGGAQGNGLSEADEVLRISKHIARRLEDHGLKVRLSRSGDYEPSGDETFNLVRSPYYENGRIAQVYTHRTNFVISSHMNSVNGTVEGLEVYSSIFTTDTWSELVATRIMEAGQLPSTRRDGLVSEGTYYKSLACQKLRIYHQMFGCTEDDLDFLFMIRESGGPKTFAAEMMYFNPELFSEIPNFGAETLLIEYAYIDNVNDAARWRKHWEDWGEAVVKATLEYLGIEYIK